MSETQKLEISLINREHTQLRVKMSPDAVNDYAEAMKNPKHDMPAIVVFRCPETHDLYLGDGYHRCKAAELLERKTISAEVRDGTIDDAILYAANCNKHNAVRFSNADKRKAVLTIVERFPRKSQRWVAEQCGITQAGVSKILKAAADVDNSKPESRTRSTPTALDRLFSTHQAYCDSLEAVKAEYGGFTGMIRNEIGIGILNHHVEIAKSMVESAGNQPEWESDKRDDDNDVIDAVAKPKITYGDLADSYNDLVEAVATPATHHDAQDDEYEDVEGYDDIEVVEPDEAAIDPPGEPVPYELLENENGGAPRRQGTGKGRPQGRFVLARYIDQAKRNSLKWLVIDTRHDFALVVCEGLTRSAAKQERDSLNQ
ncbi:MAG: hypothetical protein F9B45_28600 [Phycisphaera sp. RhM]|nr:hypothetical protein [Phycisphaera sp. RhM]